MSNLLPLGLLASTLIFWGWRSGMLLIAVGVALILESSRLLKWRWDFSNSELNRLWDVCIILFIGSGVYLRLSEEVTNAGYLFFQWFPLVFLPIAFAQFYGVRQTMPLSVFSWFLRAKGEKHHRVVNVSWIYFALVLLSASAANRRDIGFYLAITLLLGWALWTLRPRRSPGWIWVSAFLLVGGTGFGLQYGISEFQNFLAGRVSDLFTRWGRKEIDANESHTSIGQVGKLKESGRIVLRVKSEAGPLPGLLRSVVFDTFRDRTWVRSKRDFVNVPVETDGNTWVLDPGHIADSAVRISMFLPQGKGLLPLPHGVSQVHHLPVGSMETNALGVARVAEGPALVSFQARRNSSATFDEPPEAADATVPLNEIAALEKISEELGLKPGDPYPEISKKVQNFFQQNFHYSLWLKAASSAVMPTKTTPVGRFLLESREGHCEYFATATVLLMRHLQVPARYAVGYAVMEDEKDKKATVAVRERHTHAWAMVWDGLQWLEMDNTPSSWQKSEEDRASLFEPVSDFFSDLWYRFNYWRWLGEKGVFSKLAPWLLAPLIVFMLWRIFWKKKRAADLEQIGNLFKILGGDSEFREIEARLIRLGWPRLNGESLATWMDRIAAAGVPTREIRPLASLHERLRFDPVGLSTTDRKVLSEGSKSWRAPQSLNH